MRKLSDIVADRSCQPPKPNSAVIHNSETVITSRTSRSSKETHEVELSNIIHSPTVGRKRQTTIMMEDQELSLWVTAMHGGLRMS